MVGFRADDAHSSVRRLLSTSVRQRVSTTNDRDFHVDSLGADFRVKLTQDGLSEQKTVGRVNQAPTAFSAVEEGRLKLLRSEQRRLFVSE